MTRPSTHDVTRLLVAWSDGDQAALETLMPLVYQELRRLARRYLGRENPGHTLQPTALVNEAYLRLIDQYRVRWQNRAHFFGVSAQLMRRILVDMARARQQRKRGGFLNVWGIRFDPTQGKPVGEPFRVTSFENPGRMIPTDTEAVEFGIAANRLVLPLMEVSGSIWILENVDR